MLRRLFILSSLVLTALTAQASTVYTLEEHPEDPHKLMVTVDIPYECDGSLVLRGEQFGVRSQVQDVRCGSFCVNQVCKGEWKINPVHREQNRRLSWIINLERKHQSDASEQQSYRNGCFLMLSEASSLPRLIGLKDELLRIKLAGVLASYPPLDSDGCIPFPSSTQAPLFLLLNPSTNFGRDEFPNLINLIDDGRNVIRVPSPKLMSSGLDWLDQNLGLGVGRETFAIAWSGVKSEDLSCTGAAGHGVLLVNYPIDHNYKFGRALPLYVVFHEACHQLSGRLKAKRPTWVEESLASYLGFLALQHTLPEDSCVTALLQSFETQAKERFTLGLLAANTLVAKGDRSQYGAFYTKGLCFWTEVNQINQAFRGNSLMDFIPMIWSINQEDDGFVEKLREVLSLEETAWKGLVDKYLK